MGTLILISTLVLVVMAGGLIKGDGDFSGELSAENIRVILTNSTVEIVVWNATVLDITEYTWPILTNNSTWSFSSRSPSHYILNYTRTGPS
jgi:hypothetical protein